MKNKKIPLQLLVSITLLFSLMLPASAVGASTGMPLPDDHSTIHSAVDISTLASAMALNTPQGNVIPMVATGWDHIVGLKSDGTVVAVGDNELGQCNVGRWRGITQVAAGRWHTVGLKSDGIVVAVGQKEFGQRDVGKWTDIIQVAAGAAHTVGLTSDRIVVAAGLDAELAKWNLVLAVPPSEIPPVNWLLIGGIIAAVVIVGVVIFFVRRKRAAQAKN